MMIKLLLLACAAIGCRVDARRDHRSRVAARHWWPYSSWTEPDWADRCSPERLKKCEQKVASYNQRNERWLGKLRCKWLGCRKHNLQKCREDLSYCMGTTTEPPTTEPPTTEPPTTEPQSTESPTTEPMTSEFPTTALITEPPTTEPPTTEPPTTEPPTTEALPDEPAGSENESLSVTEPPTSQLPTTPSPGTESPATETPATETTATQPPTTQLSTNGTEAGETTASGPVITTGDPQPSAGFAAPGIQPSNRPGPSNRPEEPPFTQVQVR